MKKLMYMLLLFVLIGCNKDDSNKQKTTIFELTTETNKPIEDIYIYGFNDFGELKTHVYYPTVLDLESTLLVLDGGNYTFVIVVNVGDDFEFSDMMLFDFIAWVNEIESKYDDMLTGMMQANIDDNITTTVKIEIKDDSEGLKSNTLRLNITNLNNANIQDYNLRVTAEVYQKGSDNCYHRYTVVLDGQTFDLNLQAGDYEILLWVDYIPITKSYRTDHYYTTSQLNHIKFSEKTLYTACTDSRNAYSLAFEATVGEQEVTDKSITLEQALAKYRILATDVERYRIFERINDYPPIEDLIISIDYEGDLPNSFDVSTNRLIDVIQNVKYRTSAQNISDANVTIGSDYIFLDKTESVLFVTITITNKKGKIISNIQNVEINYRSDQITTISGEFLTAGIVTSDVNIGIITDWENENNHEFE